MDGWDGTVIPEQPAYKSHRRAVLIRIIGKWKYEPQNLIFRSNQTQISGDEDLEIEKLGFLCIY